MNEDDYNQLSERDCKSAVRSELRTAGNNLMVVCEEKAKYEGRKSESYREAASQLAQVAIGYQITGMSW